MDSKDNLKLANQDSAGYRDRVATIDEDGKRTWIYPKKPKGKYYNYRTWLSYVLLFLMFAGPFMRVNSQPVLLLNILERKFIILGMAFWPQDFHLFVIAMITGVVAILLFTSIFGRLFCGWVCPQTVFMEMLFRKIEYFIEGDASNQRKLDRQALNIEKIFKKTIKHVIFFALSFLIGNTLLAYIIGSDELIHIITDPINSHMQGLMVMMLFSLAFYYVFSQFREQACTMVCPYGRFQSVLLDDRSIVISYDFVRGEPRGKLEKHPNSEKGDCIDCGHCIDVCPTGIDIRNGTQLECVNCTACMDACDNIMTKIGREPNLIRYASSYGIETGETKIMTSRAYGYSAILIILIAVLSLLLFTRSDVEASILRAAGSLYYELPSKVIRNLYTVIVVIKTFDVMPIRFELAEPEGNIVIQGNAIIVEPQQIGKGQFFVDLKHQELTGYRTTIVIDVFFGDRKIETVHTNFMGPENE